MRGITFNWNVIGHENVLNFLERSIKAERVAHSYLFYGPAGIGKATIAKRFSAILQCEKQSADSQAVPCGHCLSCQHIVRGIHPDIYFVVREEGNKDVKIDQVRELRTKLFLRPIFGAYKIAIIDDAETLNEKAWNCFLKTLEEPTPKTIVVLITNQIRAIPKTIQSRSQRLHFLPVSLPDIFDYCTNELNVAKEKARLVTQLSLGRPGLALNFLRDEAAVNSYEKHVADFIHFLKADLAERLKVADGLLPKNSTFLDKIENLRARLFVWKILARDLLLLKISPVSITNIQFVADLKGLNNQYTFSDLKNMLQVIIRTQKFLTKNITPKLALENLILHL